MHLNPNAIAMLSEELDACTGLTFPVAHLSPGFLPEDVGGDVLYPAGHLERQRARVALSLSITVPSPTLEPTALADWLREARRLPDSEDWRGTKGKLPAEPDEDKRSDNGRWIVGAEAAARVLGVSRATVDRRLRRSPQSARPMSTGDEKRRWRWENREALLAWWQASEPTRDEPEPTARTSKSKSSRSSLRPKKLALQAVDFQREFEASNPHIQVRRAKGR